METQRIDLRRLRLNPENDRHGPLRDETASIQWLLEHRTAHMRALSQDLAQTKRLYERPLVRPHGSHYLVFDGNRRVCCLKLLTEPKLAPSESWAHFYTGLGSGEVIDAFSQVDCEVENDLEIIDETLLRRHTGSQDGVGQSAWDPEGKSFFLQRTGKAGAGLGESIERALKADQLIPSDLSLPWSNFERLLSSEPIRRRVGISFAGSTLTYLTDKKSNLQTLQRIANDLTGRGSRKVVLGDLWNNAQKGQYLDRLKSEGVAIDRVVGEKPVEKATRIAPLPTLSNKPGRSRDRNLISRADANPFVDHPDMERAEKIWRELQFDLEFDKHDNAIAVLMRVLLEISIAHYARKQGIGFASADNSLARRVSAVADSMLNRDFIEKKGRAIIKKFESDKPIVSAHSMHQYVHHANFHPSRTDLKAIWNVIRPLVIGSVR